MARAMNLLTPAQTTTTQRTALSFTTRAAAVQEPFIIRMGRVLLTGQRAVVIAVIPLRLPT